jgi:tRNA A-37 threonylcarbamoyl transferase component Bud32
MANNNNFQLLGSGGYGNVYKYTTRSGTVARKIFNPNMLDERDRELEILTIVRGHQNIVTYIGSGTTQPGFYDIDEKSPFIDFEYCKGNTMFDLVGSAQLNKEYLPSVEKLCDVIRGLLDALDFIHSKNIIHLDIKPCNIMIVQKNGAPGKRSRIRPVLLDFGIAQAIGSKRLDEHLGTNGYQPPEWWGGALPTTAYDIWSLGATLYELLYGADAVNVDGLVNMRKNRVFHSPANNNNNDSNDSESSVIMLPNESEQQQRAGRQRELRAEVRYKAEMKKAAENIQVSTRQCKPRFGFEVPNDIHALVLAMLVDVRQRPTIKELLGSSTFKTVHQGKFAELNDERKAALKVAAEKTEENSNLYKRIGELEAKLQRQRAEENRSLYKRIGELEAQLQRQRAAAGPSAPAVPAPAQAPAADAAKAIVEDAATKPKNATARAHSLERQRDNYKGLLDKYEAELDEAYDKVSETQRLLAEEQSKYKQAQASKESEWFAEKHVLEDYIKVLQEESDSLKIEIAAQQVEKTAVENALKTNQLEKASTEEALAVAQAELEQARAEAQAARNQRTLHDAELEACRNQCNVEVAKMRLQAADLQQSIAQLQRTIAAMALDEAERERQKSEAAAAAQHHVSKSNKDTTFHDLGLDLTATVMLEAAEPPPPAAAAAVGQKSNNTIDKFLLNFSFPTAQIETQIPAPPAASTPQNVRPLGAPAAKRARLQMNNISEDDMKIIKAANNESKLQHVDEAMAVFDWAFGVYECNVGSINKPVEQRAMFYMNDPSISPTLEQQHFGKWLVRGLDALAATKTVHAQRIFVAATGRSVHAYKAIKDKLKKKQIPAAVNLN